MCEYLSKIHFAAAVCLLLAASCVFAGPMNAGLSTSAAASSGMRMQQSRLLFEEYRTRGATAESIETASQLARDARALYGENSLAAAAWSHNLGALLYAAGRKKDALQPLSLALQLAEQNRGQRSPELAVTLRHLARVHLALGEVQLAQEQLQRAQQLLHAEYGVYAAQQLPLLNDLTLAALHRQDLAAADRQQRLYQRVSAQSADGAQARAAGHQRLGDWYLALGRYGAAAKQHKKALKILRSADLTGLPEVAAFLSLAEARRRAGQSGARRYLLQALSAVQNDRAADRSEIFAVRLALADRLQLLRQPDLAAGLYAEISRDAARTDDTFSRPRPLGLASAGDLLNAWRRSGQSTPVLGGPGRTAAGEPGKVSGGPIPVCRKQAGMLAGGQAKLSGMYAEMHYSVDEAGRVRNVRVQDTNAPPELVRFVSGLLTRYRYRPRYEAGEPVMTRNMVLHQTFAEDLSGRESFPESRQLLHQGCRLLAMHSL